MTDDVLKQLEGLPALQELRLLGGEISDDGLARLESFKNLRRLYVGGAKITGS